MDGCAFAVLDQSGGGKRRVSVWSASRFSVTVAVPLT
jgi:hypothetical protein